MKTDSFKDFALEQLDGLGEVTCRAMFGGHGLYLGKAFFGLVFKSRLFFKTNQATRAKYKQRGMEPFRPHGQQTMRYHEVPADVIENRPELEAWARTAISVALTAGVEGAKAEAR